MHMDKSNIQVKSSLGKSDQGEWDLLAQSNFFQQSKFLNAVQKSNIADSKMHFVSMHSGNKLSGSFIWTEFKLDLAIFLGENGAITWIRNYWKSFLYIDVLFCGTPVSAGQSNFEIRNNLEEAFSEFLTHTLQWARKNRIRHIIFKELNPHQNQTWSKALLSYRFFHGYSLPETTLKINWPSYQAYILSLKSRYRRQVLKSLGSTIDNIANLRSIIFEQVRILHSTEVELDDVYKKYLSVMDRAEVKLETLPREFFAYLFQDFDKDVLIFSNSKISPDASYFIVIPFKDTLYFLWTARNANKSDKDYFILLQAIIAYAIENSFKYIHLGQTAYYPKMRIGAKIEPRHIYHHCTLKPLHWILNKLRYTIYPHHPITNIDPFKKEYS